MNSNHAVLRARIIATTAHAGQRDKAGVHYIEHPQRVVALLQSCGINDPFILATAWLHDVIEDTELTASSLLEMDIPPVVVEAVIALTKVPHEPMEDYFSRVNGNSIAKVVKTADILDNSDPSRMEMLDEETRTRLSAKYLKSLTLLDM